MSYVKQNFKSGDVLKAASLNNMDAQIAKNETDISSLNNEVSGTNSEITELKEDLQQSKKEIFEEEFVTITDENKYISIDGFTRNLTGYKCTDYVEIPGKFIISIAFINSEASIAFYNDRMEFISIWDESDYTGDKYNAKNLEITPPINAKYVRWSCASDKNPSIIWSKIDNLISSTNNLNNEVFENQTLPIVISDEGKYLKEDGYFATLSGYNVVNYIEVRPSSEIHIEHVFINLLAGIVFYDSKKQYISSWDESGYDGSKLDAKVTLTTPANCHYIRWSYNANYVTSAYYTELHSKITNLEKYLLPKLLLSQQIPVASLVDDDSNAENIPTLKSICEERGISIAFAVIYTKLQASSGLLNTLLNYQKAGHTIITHPDIDADKWYDTRPEYDIKFCESTLVDSIRYLKMQGFIDCEHFVSPGGAHGEELKEMVKKWTNSACTWNNDISNHGFSGGKYDLRRIFIETANNFNYYKNKIDSAYDNGDWIIFGTHASHISRDEGLSDLIEQVLDYTISKGFNFKNYNQVIKERSYLYDLQKFIS